MIEYTIQDGSPVLRQRVKRPTLYFDQWMWVDLSRDASLRSNLLPALKMASPSLLYSAVTFLELATITNDQALAAVCAVMDAADYGFITADPREVIQREKAAGVQRLGASPAIDYDLLRRAGLQSSGITPDTPSRLLSCLAAEDAEDAEKKLRQLRSAFGSAITPMIDRARQDRKAISRAQQRQKRRKTTASTRPHTSVIWEAAIDFIALNEGMKMTSQEWLDVAHTVVPVAYLDFVLLDKRWCEFVRQLRLPKNEIACVYNRSQLDRFLEAVNSFNDRTTSSKPNASASPASNDSGSLG